ncbi:hypothetical protein ABZ532_28160 [Streptomyces sp. NPDC019396]|uniref:hypothetical protein n=1 Tax=Streptomyces sp. NPDC019396 TaxID=3154687 RepID=UPI0033EAA754
MTIAQEAAAPPPRSRPHWWGGLVWALVAGLVLVAGLALPVLAPQSAHAVPPGTYAYVANNDSDDVSVIDTSTNTVVATVPVGDGPQGVAVSPSGTGWTCTLTPLSCTRTDVLDAGESYPPLTLTVNVAADAPTRVTNTATVAGGGTTATSTATASTTVRRPEPPKPPHHGRPDHGRPDHGRPDHGRPDHGRPDHGRDRPGPHQR